MALGLMGSADQGAQLRARSEKPALSRAPGLRPSISPVRLEVLSAHSLGLPIER